MVQQQHEISEGFIRKVGRNYFMILTIDGQRRQRKTGTNDPMAADEQLQEWKAQAKMGFTQDTRLRYEDMRDHYLASGKAVPVARLMGPRDLSGLVDRNGKLAKFPHTDNAVSQDLACQLRPFSRGP